MNGPNYTQKLSLIGGSTSVNVPGVTLPVSMRWLSELGYPDA